MKISLLRISKFALFFVFVLFTSRSMALVKCIGHDYEHRSIEDVTLPTVEKIEGLLDTVKSGQSLQLTAKAKVDDRGTPFFHWCTDNGTFVFDPDYPNLSSIKFIASDEVGAIAKIKVQVHDGIGYIGTEIVSTRIAGSQISSIPSTGEVEITTTFLDDVDLNLTGKITLNDQPIQANWTPDGVAFNLYNTTGTTFDTFWQPIKLEIQDINGQEIYSGCFPFKDVCAGRWYTRPVMKLWKEGIIEGYGEGKSGIFGTYNPATRAELVAATVRAKELDNTPAPLTSSPFADVKIDDWYAPFVQYAKDTGLIQGCNTDENLFCPNDPISRAAGVKVVASAFLNETVAQFQNGQQPPRLFLDVTKPEEWFYPYVYAAEVKKAVGGYSDGNFKPEQNLIRAEMAKIICIAAFGAEECADMGETSRPFIFAVTPEIATLNEPTVFTVVGENLNDTIIFELPDCANITPIAGGTTTERLFQCTPSNTGGVKAGVVRYDEDDYTDFSVNVVEQAVPEVTSVSPTTATLNQLTTFTVEGSNLPDTLAFWIANCEGVTAISRTPEQQQFQCTPINDATGNQEGVVKDASGENKLKVFFVDVVAPVSEPVEPPPTTEPPITEPPVTEEPPVTQEPPPDTSCTPSVDSVEPLTVTVSKPITFTVSGDCLPETTAFWNDECEGLTALGGSETQRQFHCTPSWKVGPKEGVVKDEPDGNLLKSFTVSVEWGTPKVTSVSPSSASLDQLTEFAVKGQSLTGETALWIGECEGMNAIDRNTETQVFQCTPSSTPGTKEGVVKDKSGGTELYNFTVNVQ